MAAARIVEAVDVFEECHLGLPPRFPCDRRQISSALMVLKNVSTAALS